jgi:hypothetical protein
VAICKNQGGGCGEGPRVNTTLTRNQVVGGFSGVGVLFSGNNVDGSCSQCGKAASPWGANALWEVNTANPPAVPITTFQWSSDFQVPLGATYQAIEWDSQQALVGQSPSCATASVHNFGMQYDRGDFSPGNGHWRFFDYGNGHWVDTGANQPNVADGQWHTLSTNWTVSGDTVILDNFSVDGVIHTPPAGSNTGTAGCRNYSNALSFGLQLDNVPGASYTVYYKNYTASYSTTAPCNTVPTITEPFDGQSVGVAINLHATAASCVQTMNVYIDDKLVQTISGNQSPVPPNSANWISGYSEGTPHRLVMVGYSAGSPDGATATVHFTWP